MILPAAVEVRANPVIAILHALQDVFGVDGVVGGVGGGHDSSVSKTSSIIRFTPFITWRIE